MALDTACPRKLKKPKKKLNPKFFADEEACRLKENFLRLQHQFETSGERNLKKDAADAKKSYDQRLKLLRRQASANLIEKAEDKPKAMWKIVNNARNKNKSSADDIKLSINGQLSHDPLEVVNHMNLFFVNMAETTLKKIPADEKKELEPMEPNETAFMETITKTNIKEVKDTIKKLKSKNSAGIDEISSKVLKFCADELAPPLTAIFNKSFNEGQFPSKLKVSKVFPKFKSRCKHDANNYRPISLISTFSKLCERIVLQRLLDHCAQHNILSENQDGFTKGKSTTTALIKLIDSVTDSIEEGKLTTALFLDLSKAFDCLSHNIILKKLELLGIKGTANNWFKSYLKDRSQLVELQHSSNGITQAVRSKVLPVLRGVPQGSVLGPVIFILFTNDLPRHLGGFCTPLMYADDTTLFLNQHSADSLAVSSYIALNMAIQYCYGNDLVVNPSKTNQVAFGKRAPEVPAIPDVNTEAHLKFLGITIDTELNWTNHLDNLSKKLNTSHFVIKQILSLSNLETAKITYFSLFESHLRYGLAAWGGTTALNLQRILIIQKKCIRTLAGLQPLESCREAFRSLGILTVISLYIQEVIMYADGENLPRNNDVHHYNTRNVHLYSLPAHRLRLYERKPSYMGMKLHNLLPPHLLPIKGKELKIALHKWLLDQPFYTLEEYLQKSFS